jgi:hypothetical protein
MKFEFSEGQIGPLSQGMTRKTVRSVLGGDFIEFRKTEFSECTTDAYDEIGVHVYYASNELIKGVELFPASATLIYKSLQVFSYKCTDLCALLNELGVCCLEHGSDLIVIDSQIRLYVPDKCHDDNARIESAYVSLA